MSWREGREVGGESERRSRIQSLGSRRRARTRFGLVSVSSERERERETDGASHRLTDTSRHGSSSVSDHRVRRRRRRPPSGPRGRLAQDGEARRVKRVERGEGESGGEEGRKGEGGWGGGRWSVGTPCAKLERRVGGLVEEASCTEATAGGGRETPRDRRTERKREDGMAVTT